MKLLIDKKEIDLIEEVFFSLIYIIKNPLYLFMWYEVKDDDYVFLRAYALVINRYIRTNSSENKINMDVLKMFIDIRFAMVCYENDYEEIKRKYKYINYKCVYKNVKIIKKDEKYYLIINRNYYSFLLFGLNSFLLLTSKNSSDFTRFFKNFYNFDENQENYNEYLCRYFNYLGKYKKRISKNNIKAFLKRIRETMLWYILQVTHMGCMILQN